jgi:hypothetical protein
MKHRNYAIMVEENSHYPVSYMIKQNGEKVIENTMLKGGDMTENQIKELFFLGHFEEKPTQEEVDEYLDYINRKTKLKKELANWIYYEDGDTFYCLSCVKKRLIEIKENNEFREDLQDDECNFFQDYAFKEEEVNCCKCSKLLFSMVDC